jgi:hypothetical protein
MDETPLRGPSGLKYGSAERDRQTSSSWPTYVNSHTTHMAALVQQRNVSCFSLTWYLGISTRPKQDILRNSRQQIGDLPLVHVLGCRSVHAIRSKIPSSVFTPYPKYNCCESTNIDTIQLSSGVGHSSKYCIPKAPRTSTRKIGEQVRRSVRGSRLQIHLTCCLPNHTANYGYPNPA